ncbi:MAG TPA: CHAT domain-containing tetratricopeptide repeat protein [Terriglobales bacterium]|nr:CHAT domain-containing tetratricopeptide repeat protein [Terriglobales bacterium]
MHSPRACSALLLLLLLFSPPGLAAQQERWNQLNQQVQQLFRQGQYEQAVPVAEEALRVAEAGFAPDSEVVITGLINLGVLYTKTQRYSAAEPLFLRVLRLDEQRYGPEDLRTAEPLLNLGIVYTQEEKYSEAEAALRRALRIREARNALDHTGLADALTRLAAAYFRLGRYAEAEPLQQQALRIWETARGPEHPDLARPLENLAAIYTKEGKLAEAQELEQRARRVRGETESAESSQLERLQQLSLAVEQLHAQGKYAEGIPLAQEAVRLAEAILGPGDVALAKLLNNLALMYGEQGKYAEAEPLFQRSLQIREKALGSEDPEVAAALINLGELYRRQARYADAEPLFQRALQIQEKVLKPGDPQLAEVLSGLATVYEGWGRFGQAEPFLQRALRIREKALGAEHADVAESLNDLAMLYYEEGKYADAEPLYQRALRIREKVFGADHHTVAASLNGLAALYQAQGRYAEAEPLYRRALRIWGKARVTEGPDVAKALNNLGELCREQGRYAEAEPLLLRALHIWEGTEGEEHPDVATALDNLAAVYYQQGKYAQAEPLFRRSLRIDEDVLGREHEEVASSLANLALLYGAQDKYGEAQPLFVRSFDILFRNLQYYFTYMSEKERLGFLATVEYRFPQYFSFVHRFRERQPELAGRMYELLLWQKGFIAGSVASMRRQVEASGDPEALKLLDQLAAKRTQIAALLNAQPKDREAWRKQVDQLESEANDLERALVARSAAFAQQKKLERVTWQQVREALKPGEAAVEFARFRFYDGKKWTDTTYYVALVVTPESRDQPAYVVLGEGKDLEGAPLIQFQQGVQARGMEAAGESVIAPGARAYELFWKPLEPLLAGSQRVYLAPDGILNQMPLGLIPSPDGKLLLEKYDLRLLFSTKDLLRPMPAPAARTAVLIGNPAFDLGETRQRAALQELGTPGAPAPVEMAMAASPGLSRDQGVGTTLPPLPGTGAEIQAVTGLLQQRQWQVASYTADRALEEAVKRARSPRVLHLATHGFFLPDQQLKTERLGLGNEPPSGLEDPMLRSGLYFAGADRALAQQPTPEGLDDGVLTAYEATSLNLQGTELVVLSACNTGQGDVKNGEGVFGLRRALEEAGAQAVLMSLWPVPDQETQELMSLFYGKWLAGMEKHEALRQAQLEMREKVKQRYGRDLPYYWGAFVLVGR